MHHIYSLLLVVASGVYVYGQSETATGSTDVTTSDDTSTEVMDCSAEPSTPNFGNEVSTLTFFLYITIFLSLGIQYVRSYLHMKTANYPHIREVLEGVYEELSSVGVTSFILFLLESSTLPQIIATKLKAGQASEFTAVFHEVHMALFFIVFLFLITVIIVQLYSKQISRWWYMYETRTLGDNIKDFEMVNLHRNQSKLPCWLYDIVHHNRVVEVNDALAFTLIKARFMTQYAGKGGIPSNFSFARYLHLSLNEISVQCVRLHWSIWLFALTVIGINWIRFKIIPVSSTAGSAILMITGFISTVIFLFLFWKGRQIRRKLLDERHFLEPRFFAKLGQVTTIKPVSLYEDYLHHEADFTRLLTFTELKEKRQYEEAYREEQDRRLREQTVLDIKSTDGVGAATSNANETPSKPTPLRLPSHDDNVSSSGIVPSALTMSKELCASRQKIFTERRISLARVGETSLLTGQTTPQHATGAVGDLNLSTRGASFISANGQAKGDQNPLSPVKLQRLPTQTNLASPTSGNRPGLARPTSLAHLVSHKMVMKHPQQRKPSAMSIYSPGGEAATGHGLDPKLHPEAAKRGHRMPSLMEDGKTKRKNSTTPNKREKSRNSTMAKDLGGTGSISVPAGPPLSEAEWERLHEERLKKESRGADASFAETNYLQLHDRYGGGTAAALVAERNQQIYDGSLDAPITPRLSQSAAAGVHPTPHTDLTHHPRHLIPEGDELHDADGAADVSEEDELDSDDDDDDGDDLDNEEHMRELQIKQLAMQEYIKEMHDEAIRNSKLHCCVTCVPPPGSKSRLEEAFLLSDPSIHLRLFQIIMLFQSTYILASCYYFVVLGRTVQVVYLIFTFLPLTIVAIIFIPKFLRNHTITTSLHSEIRLEVVSDMMEAEQMQQDDHHMNSLHVRLQARAISLTEVPIAAFSGQYLNRSQAFIPLGLDNGKHENRLPPNWQEVMKEKKAAAAGTSPEKEKSASGGLTKQGSVVSKESPTQPPAIATITITSADATSTPITTPSVVAEPPSVTPVLNFVLPNAPVDSAVGPTPLWPVTAAPVVAASTSNSSAEPVDAPSSVQPPSQSSTSSSPGILISPTVSALTSPVPGVGTTSSPISSTHQKNVSSTSGIRKFNPASALSGYSS